jgi:hypothetical protein
MSAILSILGIFLFTLTNLLSHQINTIVFTTTSHRDHDRYIDEQIIGSLPLRESRRLHADHKVGALHITQALYALLIKFYYSNTSSIYEFNQKFARQHIGQRLDQIKTSKGQIIFRNYNAVIRELPNSNSIPPGEFYRLRMYLIKLDKLLLRKQELKRLQFEQSEIESNISSRFETALKQYRHPITPLIFGKKPITSMVDVIKNTQSAVEKEFKQKGSDEKNQDIESMKESSFSESNSGDNSSQQIASIQPSTKSGPNTMNITRREPPITLRGLELVKWWQQEQSHLSQKENEYQQLLNQTRQ